MATNLTTYAARALLRHAFRADTHAAMTQPAGVYLALFTADPTKAGTQTNEVSGGAYVREALTLGGFTTNGNFEECSNSAVNYPQASANWGTVTHIGIMDASTAGNMLAFGPLTTSKTVSTGDTFTVPATDLTVDLG